MKRLFLLTIIFTAATNLYAQQFGIGARIGPSLSMVVSDDEDLNKTLNLIGGGQIDVYTYKMFNKFVGIEGGLMLTQAGYKQEFEDFDEESETKITYFAVPLSARFKFGYFTVNPGIRPSFLIKAERDENDITDQVATTDVGMFVSPGLQFPIGITLSTTIYVGFVDVFDTEEMDIANANFSWQFSVGYTFFRKGE
jgi:hypothetical protein